MCVLEGGVGRAISVLFVRGYRQPPTANTTEPTLDGRNTHLEHALGAALLLLLALDVGGDHARQGVDLAVLVVHVEAVVREGEVGVHQQDVLLRLPGPGPVSVGGREVRLQVHKQPHARPPAAQRRAPVFACR